MEWEYLVDYDELMTGDVAEQCRTELQSQLDSRGEDGWSLVQAIPILVSVEFGGHSAVYLIYKRKRRES